MESYVSIAYLNDFVFCPRSIYFHHLYGKYNPNLYKQKPQWAGSYAHEAIDSGGYSTRSDVLQGVEVYSERYKLCGKIDTFSKAKGLLRERKKNIVRIYDGYIYQLYGQMVCLEEMGFKVRRLELYAMDQNTVHKVPLPHDAPERWNGFLSTLEHLKSFSLEAPFKANPEKCKRCIYSELCDQNAYVEFA